MIAFSERNVNEVTIKPTLYIKTFYDSNVKFKYLNSAQLSYTFFSISFNHGQHGLLSLICSLPISVLCNLSTSELRVRLARRETGLSPLVKYFY